MNHSEIRKFLLSHFFQKGFRSKKSFFCSFWLIFYPLDPDSRIRIFLRSLVRIQEAKILRIQRIRILSTSLKLWSLWHWIFDQAFCQYPVTKSSFYLFKLLNCFVSFFCHVQFIFSNFLKRLIQNYFNRVVSSFAYLVQCFLKSFCYQNCEKHLIFCL